MGATYTRGFPNPIVWPLRSCSQLKSHPATYARGATYTRVITVRKKHIFIITSLVRNSMANFIQKCPYSSINELYQGSYRTVFLQVQKTYRTTFSLYIHRNSISYESPGLDYERIWLTSYYLSAEWMTKSEPKTINDLVSPCIYSSFGHRITTGCSLTNCNRNTVGFGYHKVRK